MPPVMLNGPQDHHLHHAPGDVADTNSLAHHLEPALRDHCGGRLSSIEWFRSAWQQGGAATGFARWSTPGQPDTPVLVKFPVGPAEFRWTTELAHASDNPPTPRVLAADRTLGGYDFAWLVLERLAGRPMAAAMTQSDVHDLLVTAVDFHQAAAQRPVNEAPKHVDWHQAIDKAREALRSHAMTEHHRWSEALRHVHKHLPTLLAHWGRRAINTWCHGDLHPGNAMRRKGDPARCVLIDLALVHPGHWVEDAVYLERQFWGHSEMLHGVKPVPAIAKIRRERGLPVDDDYGDLANTRRVLMAALVPLFFEREANAKYCHAALETIERCLPQVHDP